MRRIILASLCIMAAACNNYTGEWAQYKEIEKAVTEPVFADADYPILDFGAVADGLTDSRPAINNAISACSENGGGRVVIPAGTFFCKGSIVLKSNVNLHFEDGGELFFSNDENDYLPCVLTRWEGTEVFNFSPLIYAYCVKNIAITGKGILNGNGKSHFESWKKVQKPDLRELRRMGREGVPVYERVFGPGHNLRPAMMDLISCSDILLEDVKIIDGTFWSFHLACCDNATVRRVSVDCLNLNSDGVDPECSRNVIIEDCNFHTGDDGIAIKSGRDQDGWRIGQPTENVIVRNCTFNSPLANGMCIGSEISGGVRNIFIENITILEATQGLYFKSNLDRGGYIENIHVRNVKIGKVTDSAIKFQPNYKAEQSQYFPTVMRNFHIQNVQCDSAGMRGIYAMGYDDLPLQSILIEDVCINKADSDTVIRNVDKLVLKNVRINGKTINKSI